MLRFAVVAALLLGLAACAFAQGGYDYGGGAEGGSTPPTVTTPTPLPTPPPSPSTSTAGGRPVVATVAAPPTTEGRTITIDPWTIPGGAVQAFGEQFARVGDTLVFVSQGTHGLFSIPDATCPEEFVDSPPLRQIAAPTLDGRFTVKLDRPGTRFYACPVPGHCPAGMLIQVTVTA